ncbi:ankyrin repeat and SAM domain-containing protein 4B [Falco biarmicus]|uniref:ankyrin repeat and SAM domain-containing protein 4B n=1 Tax=Falco cherrug TaxID=345164 RepID=UPI0003870CCB|nr:ankyrin repeat and SAM domain-containing protein 4B [Falco cherrug]XP_037243018.1 ankyrin repeat and SAM domain-containing protein 4B [Falco rusticolus]XP_056194585.1 ankyrin repeat and SAM domain-containing protein 4B [Falco biarmicus]
MSSRYHKAAADSNLDLLKEATKKDLNTSDEDGVTPTLLAAYHGYLEALEVICRRGGDPDKCDIWGNTPLHHAACNGHVHCVSFLINFGANIFALDNDLRTPLEVAASRDRNECVRILDKAATEQNILNPKRVSKLKAQAQRNVEKQIKECEKRQEKHQHEMNRNYIKEKVGTVNSSRGTHSRVKLPSLFASNTTSSFSKNLKDTFKLKAKKTADSTRSRETQSSDQEGGTGRTTVMHLFDEKEEEELLNDLEEKDFSDNDSQLSIFKRPGLGKIVFGRNLAADLNPGTVSSEKEDVSFKMSIGLFQYENAENGKEDNAQNGADTPWQEEEEVIWDDEDAENTPLEVFLASQMLDEFLPVFMREKIDLDALMLCSDEDLQSIQMELGPRKKVLNAVNKRKQALQNPGKTVDTCL